MIRSVLIPLSENEIHLWWAFPDNIHDAALLDRQSRTLSDTERQQYRRFVFERHRRQYLVSHTLVRDALSRYAPVAPAEWRFEVNDYGRPSIAEPAEWRGLRFNLSHTEGRSVVAVARDIELGVDVEAINARGDLDQIAGDFFSPSEAAYVRRNLHTFFDFWTLKEAYIKARGMGLAIPLDSFSLSLADPARPRIAFHEGCTDTPERWEFMLQRGDGYRMALAAATGARGRLHVIERDMVPLDVAPQGDAARA